MVFSFLITNLKRPTMWLFKDRRKSRRHPVDCNAFLHCKSLDSDDTIAVRITDISLGGVRVSLDRLQLGPRHLFIRDHHAEYELTIPAGEEVLTLPVSFVWCNLGKGENSFSLGLSFVSIPGETRKRLKSIINRLNSSKVERMVPVQQPARD